MISVIICVYNGQDYLGRAIRSYLGQTYRDTELLIVDDGSTDGTAKICDEYAGRYDDVRVIHTENKGLGGTRKTALENIQGEWVTFLDADDWMDKDWLEQLYTEATATEGVEIVIGNARMCHDGDIVGQERISMSEEYIFTEPHEMEFLVANAIAARINDGSGLGVKALRSIGIMWDKLTNVSFLRKNGIDFVEERLNEDIRFTVECFSKAGKVKYTSVIGYNYFLHDDSTSTGRNMDYVRLNQKTVEYYMNHLDMDSDIIRQAVAVAQLRFLIMDVKRVFHLSAARGEDVTDEIKNLCESDIFKNAIAPLNPQLNNLSEEERNVCAAVRMKDINEIMRAVESRCIC